VLCSSVGEIGRGRRSRDDVVFEPRERVVEPRERAVGPRQRIDLRRPVTVDPLVLLMGGLVLLTLLGLVLYLALDRTGRVSGQPSVADIAGDPQAYYGQDVTVTGEVEDGLGPTAVVLEGRHLLSKREVLVVTPQGLPVPQGRPADHPLQSGDKLQVTGTVRPFVREDVARNLGLNLDPGTFRDWEGKPAIIATDVKMTK